MKKSRAWCITDNKITPERLDKFMAIPCRYCIMGLEIAPSTGHDHGQGYIYFDNPVTFKKLQELVDGCHLEPAKGSPEQNRAYCSKDKKFREVGECPKQGRRNDIQTIKDLILSGNTPRNILFGEECSSCQAIKCAETLLKYQPPPLRAPPVVHWYWGKTGTGKTRTAIDTAGPDYWISSGELQWWNGYNGQPSIILDDLRASSCEFSKFLRIIDRYPVQVPIKGTMVWLMATFIIITSPFEPSTMWHISGEDIAQLLRRITLIREFK